LKLWNNEINKTFKTQIDAKTKLQEYSLKIYKRLPLYKTITALGLKHKLTYKVVVKIEHSAQFVGNGKSIKIAQQNAARKLLDNMEI
jgi:ribonuclease-3